LESIHTIQEPEKHGLEFHIKVRLVNYCNDLKSRANPLATVEALKAIPFHFGISYHFDEPTEMCDIVFPEPSPYERWEVFAPGMMGRWEYEGLADRINNYQGLRHPVVTPIYNTKDWGDVMMELAARTGRLDKWNAAVNQTLALKDEYKLEPGKKYEWKDVLDRQLKSTWGEEFGVEWFRVNGPKGRPAKGKAEWYPYTKNPKTRQPLYDEWLLWVAKQYREDRKKAGLPDLPVVGGVELDVYSELIPLPEWLGTGPLEKAGAEYDLYAVNYGDPLIGGMCMAMENPWLTEYAARFNPYIMNVLINTTTAQTKGIKTGDRIEITSQFGHTVHGEAFVTEAVHPECLGIGGCYGSYSQNTNPNTLDGTHFNWLCSSNRADIGPSGPNIELSPKVKVRKV
jgi:molybdopterin-containing oxidoreductase family molybdopterin binding subunit